MRSKIILLSVATVLFSFLHAFSEEKGLMEGLEGSITLDSKISNIAGNKAKFNEYRDIRDGFGAYGSIHADYDTENFLMNFKADDIGYDTQSYRLEGGIWGKFKTYFEYNQIPHNFTFHGRSFYSGVGEDNLTYPTHPPSSDISTWDEFDYSIERKRLGGGFNFEMLRPFYFDVSALREKRDGIFPLGAAGTTPGGIAIELPEPIDYTTDNIKLEAGYSKNPVFLSLGFLYSEFKNSNTNLNFRNPASGVQPNTDSLTLPPDNDYYKLAFKGAVRLPVRSKLNMNLGFSRAKADADLASSYVSTGITTITLSNPDFKGKIETQNYNFVLSSNPISFLDGKVFYKHYKTDNKSDEIITIDGANTYVNPLFDYKKDTYGLELGFRLPAHLYLSTGYNFIRTKREREDLPINRDNLYSAELRWSGWEFMLARIGYERLQRDATFRAPDVASSDPRIIETWVRRFDAAEQDRNTYTLSVDLFPVENLNFVIEYRHKDTDYKKTILGLEKERSDGVGVDADYIVGKFGRLFGYFAYERIKGDQFQRQLPFNATSGFDPSLPPTPSIFNWEVTEKDREFDYGIGTDIYVIPKKLTLTLKHDYVRSNGSADFTYLLGTNPLPAGRDQKNIDISFWDDYRLKLYMIKAVYNATNRLSFSVGYAYEKFKYNNAQYDGYQFVPATSGTNGAYLTGAYRDPSYSASVVFLGARYKF
ncbi:MAG: MtrB/PioB family decaheme-associated outer membrane protein [Syntrophaceae bacterium]|nr:MtrB/PioB family decaheme-associated outer membrane protein [Syntrophaceae bacterium]